MCVECGVSAVCPAPSLSAFFLWHKVSLNLELGLQSTSLKSSCLCPQSAGVMSTHAFTLNFLHIFCDLNSGSYACTGSDSAHWAIPLHGIYTHFLKSVEDRHVGKKKKRKKTNLKSTKMLRIKYTEKQRQEYKPHFFQPVVCFILTCIERCNSSLNLELTDSARQASKPLRTPVSAHSNQIPDAQCLAWLMWVLEIQVQVLTFTQQVLYPLSYLPSSVI